MFINLDVLAYIGCTTLNIQCSNHDLEKAKNTAKIVENMSCLTNYNGIANVTPASDNYGSPETNDAYAFYLQGIPFIEFGEQQYWNIRHKTGCSHSKGDVMSELDYNDLNRTTDIVWNVTKYYCVNPDCWFSNGVTYQAVDSPNDGDTLADSIQATFTVNSAIHHDEIMVKGILIDDSTGEKVATVCKNFTVISSEVTGSISVLIPSTYDEGDFRLSLELYNSTGKINVIVNPGGDYDDDTDSSPGSFHLFHPFGYIIAGKFGQSINNRITGSVFTIHQNGIADSITAYVSFLLSKPSKCMIYRLSDSKLIGVTQEISGSTSPGGEWRTYPFSEPKPVLVKDTQYVLVCWCGGIFGCLYYNNFVNPRGRYDYEPYGVPPQYIGFTNENRLYSIYCSYTSPQAQSTYYFNGYNILEAWATNPGYMVDGLINRFASSNISEDVEWCNSNNCSGTNLGDISKVEIRAYTYRTGGLGNMILRPVFGASSDGNNHGFTPPLGLKYATWSSWFDVTNDNHAPTTWTWSDIKNLDCDVEVGASGSFPNPTMYCSKIEVRVTYSP
jgi:hypothetical protein